MRKLLTFLIALALIVFAVSSPSQAQVGQIPSYLQPAPSGGSPTEICSASLVAWHKADVQVFNTGTTPAANGQTLSGWQDQSGKGNHLIVNFTWSTRF